MQIVHSTELPRKAVAPSRSTDLRRLTCSRRARFECRS
jgi:hypothetical protein